MYYGYAPMAGQLSCMFHINTATQLKVMADGRMIDRFQPRSTDRPNEEVEGQRVRGLCDALLVLLPCN
jgi:hypothetical protein